MTTSVESDPANATPPAPVDSAATPPTVRRRAAFHLLKVADLDYITDDAVAITFEVPEHLREEFRFIAGQHLSLRCTIAGDDVRRNYSICVPATSGKLRVGVKRLAGGVFSSYAMERLRVGDTLEVLTPSGRFFTPLDPTQTKHYGAVAAGSGITPVLSIISTALEVEPQSRATLIFANRTTASIMFLEELEDLKNKYMGRFQMVHVLDAELQDAELLSGRLDAERLTGILERLIPGDDVDDWFLCGPRPMTDSVRDVLLGRGVDDEHIHRELFHADAAPPKQRLDVDVAADTGAEVTVVLDGRGTSFKLPPNTIPVLDAALRLRGDAPFACKNGVCGTCRAKLVEGTVDMAQNYALEKDELANGYVLACQAYPTSDRMVLDFDQ